MASLSVDSVTYFLWLPQFAPFKANTPVTFLLVIAFDNLKFHLEQVPLLDLLQAKGSIPLNVAIEEAF